MYTEIYKGQTNNCVFTLTEKTTLDSPFYLLQLYSNQNQDFKVVRLSGDVSTNTYRYNEFPIVESDTENLSAGTISLTQGTYSYFIWQTSASTLSVSDATSIVESGKLIVIGTATTESTYSSGATNYTYVNQ